MNLLNLLLNLLNYIIKRLKETLHSIEFRFFRGDSEEFNYKLLKTPKSEIISE